jgi:peptide/nickel transport system ATP-binding protein
MLKVTNLSISFGKSVVLSNVSFTLAKGESIGFVGESGSGKTITSLALMGLLPPNATVVSGCAEFVVGSISINLLRATHKQHQFLRGKQMGMVFQEPMTSLNPSMRCGRQIEESLKLHLGLSGKNAQQRCLDLLEEMQLPNPKRVYRSFPHQLSGGQKQRVMIGMALAANPSLLIADEPTTALDVTVQKEILLLLRQLQQARGMSLIFISHDLGVLSGVTNRLLVLRNGEVVEQGETKNLLSAPNHSYTKGLLACRPPLNGRPTILPTMNSFLAFHEQLGTAQTEELFAASMDTSLSADEIISVQNLDVVYQLEQKLFSPNKVFRAVEGMSFNLYKGETLGLVGESGCGKSTVGRAILGLTKPSTGKILFMGNDIEAFSHRQMLAYRQKVQLIFQDPYSSLNPRHTIGETLMEPLKVHGKVYGKAALKARALELLQSVSLPTNSFYRYPHEFSGGQRQRIAIARALALEPDIIVCDEMVSALDVSVQAQILNLLNRLKSEHGLTYLFISHDLSVVRYMSNRMMVMQEGKLVEWGNADELFSNPQSDYTKKLINSIPRIQALP